MRPVNVKPFPTYLELPGRVPPWVWRGIRVLTVSASVGLCALLVVDPDLGLRLWWRSVVPLLPLVWFLAPGIWRNSCPLSATNQAPRLLRITRGWAAPEWFRTVAPIVGMAAFFSVVVLRPMVFDHSGPATAALIVSALVLAFVGGLLLKGKSGWCSSICPLLPVQRMYGQTPLVAVPNAHCRPCVGCTKNCYDFNPRAAHLADLHDEDPHWGMNRKFFAGTFPGLVYGFNTVGGTGWIHARDMLIAMAVGAGSFTAVELSTRISAPKLAAVYAATALNLFYWWSAPVLSASLLGSVLPGAVWPLRGLVLVLTVDWLRRTFKAEAAYGAELELSGRLLPIRPIRLGEGAAAAARSVGAPELVFDDGDRVEVPAGSSVLQVAEGAGKRIEAGCRMGVCGADPVCVRSGGENLSPMGAEERATLERLGLSPECHRLACSARVEGPAEISLTPDRSLVHTPELAFPFDPEIRRVVIVGNGIAGVTTADHLRRRHPEVQIDVVAAEPHTLYNRMGISRLIYGRSAMVGLHLLPDQWYDEHRITCWLNTRVASIDRDSRTVRLATGEDLGYDRLVLATGSEARRPPIPGLERNGFVLRSSADAVAIRQHCQITGARTAVVAGGGLLGVEAAYALHKLGLRVTVLERGPWLLGRQVDAVAGELLATYLHNLGITVELGAGVAEVRGGAQLEQVVLEDGRVLDTDVLLVAAGVEAATGLASAAGLDVERGVLVDDHLRTSDPAVYAVGDVAECAGEHFGLWPAAVEQAEVCAENVAGGDRIYEGHTPVTLLKVVGVDLASAGTVTPPVGGSEHVRLDRDELRYKKIVLDDAGRVCGAILLGHAGDGAAVLEAVKQHADPSSVPVLRDLVEADERTLDPAV